MPAFGADGFDPADWDDKYNSTGAAVDLDNKSYGSPNYFMLHIFPPKINPDWDPTDPTSPMWVYGPSAFNFDMSSFADDTTISSQSGGVGYNVDNSTFNGQTSISQLAYTGGHMMDVNESVFNDNTSISTYDSKASSGDVGTQINQSTFNDNTSFSVMDGGILELNDSTINLANDDLMSKYFGLSTPNPDSIFQRIYYGFFSSIPLAYSVGKGLDGVNYNPLISGFYCPKLGGYADSSVFDDLVVPSGFGYLNYNSSVYSTWNLNNPNILPFVSGNFAYFSTYTLYPLFQNFFIYSSSDNMTFDTLASNGNNSLSFIVRYLFKTTQYTPGKVDERPVLTGQTVYCTLPALVDIQFKNLSALVTQVFNVFADWYYPLSTMDSLYWQYFNTDTGQKENINLAGLMYNISWYLGQMFQMNIWDLGDSGLADSVDDLSDTLSDYDSAESDIFSSVESGLVGIESKLDLSFAPLTYIAQVSGWLTTLWNGLGSWQAPTLISFSLVICMQFIGYFKYKFS